MAGFCLTLNISIIALSISLHFQNLPKNFDTLNDPLLLYTDGSEKLDVKLTNTKKNSIAKFTTEISGKND